MNARILIVAATSALVLAGCSASKTGEAGSGEAARPSAMGKEFTLASQNITLPTDENETFAPGPNVDTLNIDCRACHSPSMILVQPPLKHDEWVKEVDKMRTTFKAPIADEDVPKIVAYLDAYSAQQAGAQSQVDAPSGAEKPTGAVRQ